MQDGYEHVPFERLLAFVEGGLPPEAEADVQRHLDIGCDLCAGEVGLIRREIAALQACAWPVPSTAAHRRAVRAFRGLPTAARPRPRRLRWTTALAGLAIIVLLALVGPLNPLGGVAYAASLTEVTGQIQVRLEPSAQWSVPSPGSLLPAGAEIRTGAQSRVVLVFPGGDRALLSDSTSLSLEDIARTHGQWQIAFVQINGTTDNYVQEDTSEYRVRTPAGEAVADGTRFVVRMNEDGTVEVDVGEGSVTMIDPHGSSVQVSAGHTALFPPGANTPVPPVSSGSDSTSTPAMGDEVKEGDGQNDSDVDTGDGQSNGVDSDLQNIPSATPTP